MVRLPGVAIVALNAAVWVAWSLGLARLMTRRPAEGLRPARLERIRRWEADGRWYRTYLRVHRWKDRLPEAGAMFGGLSKRHLPTVEQGGLDRFARECLRAERTHLLALVIVPLFALWNPPLGVAVNAAYALVANVPFVVVARFNRARAERVLRLRAA